MNPITASRSNAGSSAAGTSPSSFRQSHPTQPTLQELRQWVIRWSRENPHLTGRLEKAAFLVLLRDVQEVAPNSYLVGAEDGLRDYAVVDGECECTDFQRHGLGHLCKHRLAVAFVQRL